MKEARIDVSLAVCPDPVGKIRMVLDTLREQNIVVSKIEIIGDQALEAIENFLINNGYIIETIGDENRFSILVKGKEEIEVLEFLEEKPLSFEEKILFLKYDGIGEGELGRKLLDSFFVSLSKGVVLPQEILLLNRAVLLCADSKREATQELLYLERKGVKILACKTCLEYYGVFEKMSVGEVSSSAIITQKLITSKSVISL